MKTKQLLICLVAVLLLVSITPLSAQKINLGGEWKFAADPLDKGINEKWFSKPLAEKVTLPGSMSTNNKGDDITLTTKWTGQIVDSSYYKNPEYARYRQPGNIKIPFWLQSLKHYQGAAWYQKEIVIPANWKDKTIRLFLERCHWESRLWVDDQEIGLRNSLGTPHSYDFPEVIAPGKHRLTICVDNRTKEIDPGLNSHSISDHTQTNWNGIVGKLYLEARPLIHLKQIQTYPDIQQKAVEVKIAVENPTGNSTKVGIKISVEGVGKMQAKNQQFDLQPGLNNLTVSYLLGNDCQLWNEFHPTLYRLKAVLSDPASQTKDSLFATFGMREIRSAGKQILVNNQPVFLRGTLECAIFPKTGYPPTDTKDWLRIFAICRAHGLNHMRFHSWCPPEAAFEAADQTGFYLQVECSSWANQSTTLGDGKPFDKYLYEESQRMVDTYGNHPSFCMLLYGNEPAGKKQVPFLTDFVRFWKEKDARRIYTSGAGWPDLPVNDYLSTPSPRIQGWGEALKSIINGFPPSSDYDWSTKIAKYTQPVVSHEIGQWCVYPAFKEIPKYKGVVRARNFEIFQETLKENGMEQLADSFLLASGKLQALCYKADIEAALRTPGFAGFQLLDLHDFPGQGTALVGVLDAFWDEKGYISPKEYKRFCNSTVPLARMKKMIFNNDETFSAKVEVAHYGDKALSKCIPEWRIKTTAGKTVKSGKWMLTTIETGKNSFLGEVTFPLNTFLKAQKLIFEVSVGSYTNSWDMWVYPAKNEEHADFDKIKTVTSVDVETLNFLEKGGRVLLTVKKGELAADYGGDVAIGFSSIFWNTAWTRGQAPHTLGILCNPAHPALADFPTEYHSNWQWWDGMSHSGAINLSKFPVEIKPIVRVIDDWFKNRPLALLLEGRVGKGRVLISGIDLQTDLSQRPEARQLLFSLKKYMAGPDFNPKVVLDASILSELTKNIK